MMKSKQKEQESLFEVIHAIFSYIFRKGEHVIFFLI